MSETPGERQTDIEQRGGERVGPVEAEPRAPGSRTLQAGGEFLKALASDLAAVASGLRLWLIPKHRLLIANRRQTRPPPASAPTRVSPPPAVGRLLWRVSVALLWFVSICAGALAAVTLWVLFGFPPEPQTSGSGALGSQFEARKGGSRASVGPLNVTGASRRESGREPGAQGRPAAEVRFPSSASSAAPPAQSGDSAGASDDRSFRGSGSSSAAAAEPVKAAKEMQTEAGAGADQRQLARTEPQDRRPAARQQDVSGILTDLRPRTQCNLNACAARYNSFHAADCTYQPYGGGPRQICELSARSAEAPPQTSGAASDPESEAPDKRVAERAAEIPKPATPAPAGAQCNIDACAATYNSFHAADCTYQPYGGGPRRICER